MSVFWDIMPSTDMVDQCAVSFSLDKSFCLLVSNSVCLTHSVI